MAASIPSSAQILTPSKNGIQISHDSSSSLKSKGRQLPKAPATGNEVSTTKGTVLVRQPLPKYSFLTSKKSKSSEKLNNEPTSTTSNGKSDEIQIPVGAVKPVSKVEPNVNKPEPSISQNEHLKVDMKAPTEAPNLELVLRNPSPLDWPGSSDAEVKRLKDEVLRLKGELDVQVKVNSELKKLLVASVGDDLHSRVERLARDRAELTQELGVTTQQRSEDYENLDAVSIQADMWRSKYLASRVMSDELASAKSFFALQYQESQNALEQLLDERHELRTNLVECNRCLQQIRAAFDPLNSQRVIPQNGSNNLDLATNSHSLAESIKYRLLPSNVTPDITFAMDARFEDAFTHAEAHANELLSRRVTSSDIRTHLPSAVCNTGSSVIARYHPKTKFDNLTFNCCPHCKGEIHAL